MENDLANKGAGQGKCGFPCSDRQERSVKSESDISQLLVSFSLPGQMQPLSTVFTGCKLAQRLRKLVRAAYWESADLLSSITSSFPFLPLASSVRRRLLALACRQRCGGILLDVNIIKSRCSRRSKAGFCK